MSLGIRGVALVLLLGATVSAQSPTIEALLDQVLQLKKQLALEKARADELAAEARAQAEQARAQAEAARRAEQQARLEAERALAAAREAAQRAKAARPNAELAEAEAGLAQATALLNDQAARLEEIAKIVKADHPVFLQQQERVTVARKAVAEAQARVAALRKQAGPADVDQLRKELEAIRAEAQRLAEAAQAERKAREQAEKAELERRELLKRLEQETTRAVASEIEKRTLLDRVKQLEQRVAELEKQLRGKPGNEEPRRPEGNRPAEDIKGTVKKVDAGLALLDIGADVGLKVGHTLEAFRLGDTPTYLGALTIVSVEARSAVARPTGKLTADLQAGDSVASRIR